MTISEHSSTRLKLPAKSRSRRRCLADLTVRLDLVDRIAGLDDIDVTERADTSVPCRVDVILRSEQRTRTPKNSAPHRKLCSFSRDGITVCGLDRQARWEVVSRGWGRFDMGAVRLNLPRNNEELEIVWNIVKRAYDEQHISSGSKPGTRVVSTWDWPKFSRTSLQ